MVKQQTKILALFLYLGDLGATILAFFCAYWLRGAFPQERFATLSPFSWYFNLLLGIVPVWFLLFYLTGLYRFRLRRRFWQEMWMVFKAVTISCLILGFIVFALKLVFVSRIFLFLFAFLDLFLTMALRYLFRRGIFLFHRKREDFRMILIIGRGERAANLARIIERHQDLGLKILGFLSPNGPVGAGVPESQVLGRAADLPSILESQVVDEVIFALSQEELKPMENLFLLCEERGITARVAMNLFPHVIARTQWEELDGIPLLTFSTTPKNELLLFLRRGLDFLGSLFLLVLLSPLFLLITVLIRWDSEGPALYRQVRCGVNGRRFMFYKFRSMYPGAEDKKGDLAEHNVMAGPVFKMKNDPRVTRVGRILRKTSLDELPQLLNVLKGDMSFVGPRPPIPEEVEQYEGWQRRRLSMKPGITGLWQVSGRNEIDFSEWMKMDLAYIDNWSLWLDAKILLKTIPVILSGKGAM